jgi:prephenate dehydratase
MEGRREEARQARDLSSKTTMPAKLRVAIQGERGSFSYEVAVRMFGDAFTLVSCETFPVLFSRVFGRQGEADVAIVPIENALYGSIHQNYDLLVKYRARIVAEAYHRIEMCLIGRDEAAPKRGDTVLVHPVAAGQCTKYLRTHKLNARFASDTAGSVRELMESVKDARFAIASPAAASLYGGKVVARAIQDDPKNFTRFFAVTRQESKRALPLRVKTRGARMKTALACVLPNEPGSLFRALGAFSLRDVDLSKLESRPIRGRPFDYLFYLEAQGGLDEPRVKHAVLHLAEMAEKLTVLGSYPSAHSQ